MARSLDVWLEEYDSVDLDFDVVVEGKGRVGTGRLKDVLWDHSENTRT